MGLDIYFEKRKNNNQNIVKNLAYFRKVNFLVSFFEVKVGGLENCEPKTIEKWMVEQLIETCCEIANTYNKNKDNRLKWLKLAESTLPTTDGFFFGSTEYDKYYIQDVRDTRDMMRKILPKFDTLKEGETITIMIDY